MTNTDTDWNTRLAQIMPDNFLGNMGDAFSVGNNAVLTDMMNMIGRTVINGADNPMNPFAKYTKPMMEYGDTVQDYKVKYVEGQKYDPLGTDPFGIKAGSEVAQYYKLNDNTQYQSTIYDREFRKAFASETAFNDFVAVKLDAIMQSDALDKWTKWKKYISDTANLIGDNANAKMEITTGTDYAGDLLDALRSFAEDKFRAPSTKYNAKADTAISSSVDIIMKRTDKLAIDKYLSGVYNMDKLNIDANIILVDDFATPTGTAGTDGAPTAGDELVAVVCDSRAMAYTPTLAQSSTQYNAKGLYNNHFYTVEGVYSVAKFRNFAQVFAKVA